MTTESPTCEICGKSLTYAGRGRPPKRCEEHKRTPLESKESTVPDSPRPRPRPGQKSEDPAPAARPRPRPSPVQAPTAEHLPPPAGTPDVQSRNKAQKAHDRTNDQNGHIDSEGWPRGANGTPMARIMFTASELVPTGQYANVSVGPAQITVFVDMDRIIENSYFSDDERVVLVSALNELAETVERDVVAVQRSIVLESMQEQLAS